ncbi:MAG: exodeoxyribonuclease VII large subunit [Bacteroidales bacterium]
MSEERLSLLELQKHIKWQLETGLESHYWIVAEISDFNVNYKGHCYLSLVQKDKNSDKILAKARGIIWAMRYRMLSAYFESQTRESLKSGLKILVKVRVNYHEQYGLSLQIFDIDPTYTLGDVEKRRKEIIAKLEEAGIMHMNKTLELPPVFYRIAIISSDTAAGFGDFIAQMETNKYHYAFRMQLFRAAMQGEDTEASVITALEQIFNADTAFDLVVIIRGGGARTDLSWFDNYNIASHIAQFPIPVFSGIGHERDASVTDMVAHSHIKTPTAVAEAIISHNRGFEENLDNDLDNLLTGVRQYLRNKSEELSSISKALIPGIKTHLSRQNQQLDFFGHRLQRAGFNMIQSRQQSISQLVYKLSVADRHLLQNNQKATDKLNDRLIQGIKQNFLRENHKLERIEDKLNANDPHRLLEKGFTLTSLDGKPLTSAKQVNKGRIIKTRFKDGNIESEVQ